MKYNTQRLKSLLHQALRECPQDFTLSEARYHLNAALTKVEQVEKKRERRQQAEQEQYQQHWGAGTVPGMGVKETLHYIDSMIAEEKRKIDEIAERRKKQQTEGDDDVSAILG